MYGQLGNGATVEIQDRAIQIRNLKDIHHIAAGHYHSVAVSQVRSVRTDITIISVRISVMSYSFFQQGLVRSVPIIDILCTEIVDSVSAGRNAHILMGQRVLGQAWSCYG